MKVFCCGVVESRSLLDFPYGGQPILCTPVGTEWQRVQYKIANGLFGFVIPIGPARPLEDHSFRLGDYVLCEPIPFLRSSFAIVFPSHKIGVSSGRFDLITQLTKGLFSSRFSFIAYVVRAFWILKDAHHATKKRKIGESERFEDDMHLV
jgi:hypothetical protein